jgi:16S rRNA (cytidine1402-2'-O)-methyltransferase
MTEDSSVQPPKPEPDAAQPHAAQPDVGTQPALMLVSTPIGNLADVSIRSLEALASVDIVLCEDTRSSAVLFRAHGIKAKLEALHEHNEEARIPALIAAMGQGRRYALISDAGTPLVSDPGYRLVRAAIGAGLAVSAVPGPNAATMALTLSGLPPAPYYFAGFLPPKAAGRRAALDRLRAIEAAGLAATIILYEAPHRLAESLADAADILGPRPAAVCRELTKRFEEVRRALLPDLAAHYAGHEARGEIVVVIGPPEAAPASTETLDAALDAALACMSVKDAVAAAAAATGLPRKLVYARALERQGK